MGDPEEPTVKERRSSADTAAGHGNSSPKNTDLEAPRASAFDTNDRFETRGELGRGGMGRVDDAYDRALGRQVAIKHVLSHAEVDLARFEREARITARLEHPGIVPVHDVGRSEDGSPYYIMRRVDGEPLSELIADKPFAERVRLVPNILAACDAAAFAHSHGIVHRDIKPTNILVGPFGETLLIDWGLAREVSTSDEPASAQPISDGNLTRAGTVAGTPGFMSPEQARGETVDARADVFALGATLFYVLAGQLPWHGGSTEMLQHVGAGRPPDWRLMPAEVPADLRAIVEKAMSRDLADRYADATALAADLRRFTLGNLVAAYNYGWFARVVRFVRKHRAAASIAAISIVALAVVGIISFRRVVAERDAANQARTLAEARQREARAAADRLLVQHAHELVATDPLEAIAALRTLAPDSLRWRDAWVVAMEAKLAGIPIGFRLPHEPGLMQVSADRRHIFWMSLFSPTLLLIDLPARSTRELALGTRIFKPTWFDATHLIATTDAETILLDITSGQRRAWPFVAKEIASNRAGLARIFAGTTLYELTASDATPRVVAEGLTGYESAADLSASIYIRGGKRNFVVGDRSYPLPDLTADEHKYATIYAISPTTVVMAHGYMSAAWDLVDGKLLKRGEWPQQVLVTGVFSAGNYLYMTSGEGVSILGRAATREPVQLQSQWRTQLGFLAVYSDGSIVLRDGMGTMALGKRHASYVRVDASPDGRTIAALTTAGEVLVWDLDEIRPELIALERTESPRQLSNADLWTTTMGEGIYRIDLRTHERVRALDIETPLVESAYDRIHDWLLVRSHHHGLTILARDRAPVSIEKVDLFSFGQAGIVYTRKGYVTLWTPNGETEFGSFSPVPTIAAPGKSCVYVLAGDSELLRIDIATRRTERVTFPVTYIAIDDAETAWFAAGGKAYRWDRAAPAPVALPSPEIVDSVGITQHGALFHSSRALVLYGKQPWPRVFSIPTVAALAIDKDLLATLSSQGVVVVLDLETGGSFTLPGHHDMTHALVASVTHVGMVNFRHQPVASVVALFSMSVPREPAELQKWLANVTNARPIEGSEAVAFP
ncbi:MAG TPA: serine/threonine-protein kinase [Kofleriaceae bacterium]|nr:serine/threonine-protein kinase [Kofleriaceae bacterium]